MRLELMALMSKEDSGDTVQMYRLPRAFTALIHKVWMYMKTLAQS